VNYKAQLTPWLSVQPDFQVFFHPGGQSSRETTFLLGVRGNVVF
jgi:carbohydrate-selective porin OprB